MLSGSSLTGKVLGPVNIFYKINLDQDNLKYQFQGFLSLLWFFLIENLSLKQRHADMSNIRFSII